MKRLLILFAVVLVAAGLFGRNISPTQAVDGDETAWTCPEGYAGQTLRVFNWTTYIADDTLPRFEELCGVTVEYFEYGSSEEMVTIVRNQSAQYDIAVPAGNSVGIMITEELVQPLNYDLIPNAKNLNPALLDQAFDPGNVYSLPYQWGTVGVGYDATVIDEPIETWADFFAYEGRVAWLDDQRIILGIGLALAGFDPNSTNEEEVMAGARYLLDEGKGEVFEIAADTGQDLLLRGEVDAVIEYSGDILQIAADCECEDFVYVIPSDYPALWTDNMVIPFNAPNPELAHVFMDYILDAHVGAELSDYTAYATPNLASLALLPEEQQSNTAIYPSEETLANGFVANYIGDAEQFYNDAWNMIQAELSQ
jgi:spermidine/putrescine transport system substrate-binding protein